jgi:hypothetical protein
MCSSSPTSFGREQLAEPAHALPPSSPSRGFEGIPCASNRSRAGKSDKVDGPAREVASRERPMSHRESRRGWPATDDIQGFGYALDEAS